MFFIVWRGWGILAPLILFFTNLALELSINNYTNNNGYSQNHLWVSSVGLVLGGLLCWVVGKKINRRPARIVIDEKTGQRIALKSIHSCFGIPLEFWFIVGVLLAIINIWQAI